MIATLRGNNALIGGIFGYLDSATVVINNTYSTGYINSRIQYPFTFLSAQ